MDIHKIKRKGNWIVYPFSRCLLHRMLCIMTCWWPRNEPSRLTVMSGAIAISPCVCSCVSCERLLSDRFIAHCPPVPSVHCRRFTVHRPLSAHPWPFSTAHGCNCQLMDWLLSRRLDYLTGSYSGRDYLANFGGGSPKWVTQMWAHLHINRTTRSGCS